MTKFNYIDSLDKITGNEIETWAMELDNDAKDYTNPEIGMNCTQCLLLEPKLVNNKDVEQLFNGGDFMATLINKRLKVLHTYTLSNAFHLFLSMLVKSPGEAVEYLNYLQYISFAKKINNFDMNIVCRDLFPMGFFSDEVLHKHWDAQKVRLSPDNLLDHPSAGKSIGVKLE